MGFLDKVKDGLEKGKELASDGLEKGQGLAKGQQLKLELKKLEGAAPRRVRRPRAQVVRRRRGGRAVG